MENRQMFVNFKPLLFALLTMTILQTPIFNRAVNAQSISDGVIDEGTYNVPLGNYGNLQGNISYGDVTNGQLTVGGFNGNTYNIPISNLINGNYNNILGDLLPEPIAELFRDIALFVGKIETFLADLGLEVDLGELGFPDVEEAIELFEENNEIAIAADVFGTQTGSTFTIADNLYKQYLKDLGNEYALNSTLSEEGQEKTVEQIEISQETAEISNLFAEDSNTQDVSQNILRNISNQLALQQQLDNMSFFGNQEEKLARSLTLSMQGENLVALDSLNARQDMAKISNLKTALYYQGLLSIPLQYKIQ